MLFGSAMRLAREDAGLSRGELRLRILRFFDTAPTLSAIRDLENGQSIAPQAKNLSKIKRALPKLDRFLTEPKP